MEPGACKVTPELNLRVGPLAVGTTAKGTIETPMAKLNAVLGLERTTVR